MLNNRKKSAFPKDLFIEYMNDDIKRLEKNLQFHNKKLAPFWKRIGINSATDEYLFLAFNKYHGYWRLLYLSSFKEYITFEDIEREGIPLIRAPLTIRLFAHQKENFSTRLNGFIHDLCINP